MQFNIPEEGSDLVLDSARPKTYCMQQKNNGMTPLPTRDSSNTVKLVCTCSAWEDQFKFWHVTETATATRSQIGPHILWIVLIANYAFCSGTSRAAEKFKEKWGIPVTTASVPRWAGKLRFVILFPRWSQIFSNRLLRANGSLAWLLKSVVPLHWWILSIRSVS